MAEKIAVDRDRIAESCRRWRVKDLSLFSSVLRDEFKPESDVDVLVAFEPGERRDLFDVVAMKRDLADVIGRKVDLVLKGKPGESIPSAPPPLRSRR